MTDVLVFLQNAYDAYGVKDGYVPSITCDIFKMHHTGRRLKSMLPTDDVEIRNCTPEIGKGVSSNLKPDIEYMKEQIKLIKPRVILCCGKNAGIAIRKIDCPCTALSDVPHPAYRALSKGLCQSIKQNIERILNE